MKLFICFLTFILFFPIAIYPVPISLNIPSKNIIIQTEGQIKIDLSKDITITDHTINQTVILSKVDYVYIRNFFNTYFDEKPAKALVSVAVQITLDPLFVTMMTTLDPFTPEMLELFRQSYTDN